MASSQGNWKPLGEGLGTTVLRPASHGGNRALGSCLAPAACSLRPGSGSFLELHSGVLRTVLHWASLVARTDPVGHSVLHPGLNLGAFVQVESQLRRNVWPLPELTLSVLPGTVLTSVGLRTGPLATLRGAWHIRAKWRRPSPLTTALLRASPCVCFLFALKGFFLPL
jgi:hypothetical protein